MKNVLETSKNTLQLASLPKYLVKDFLGEWLSSKDLLKVLSARARTEDERSQRRMFVYTLTALFLRQGSDSDLKYHTCLLAKGTNNALFKIALSDEDFISSLKKSLRSSVADGFYRNSIFEMWTQYQITTHPSEIHPNSVDTRLVRRLENISRRDELDVISALIPYFEPAELGQFIASILAELSDEDSWVRCTVLITIAQLIPKLETAELRQFIAPIWAGLNDKDSNVRSAALGALTQLISKLETAQLLQLIAPLLAMLDSGDSSVRSAALDAMAELISELEPAELGQFIASILARLNDESICVRSAALGAMAKLISRLETAELEQFIAPILAGLNDEYSGARSAALDAMAKLISKLEPAEVQQLIDWLLASLSDTSDSVEYVDLKHRAMEFRTAGEDFYEIIKKLAYLNNKSAVLKALNLLVSKLNQENLTKIFTVLKRCLDDSREEIRTEALTTLSRMMVCYPDYPYTFDARNASKERVALIKQREMQAMIRGSDKDPMISHSNLKTILGTYKTKSWYGQFVDALRWMFGFATTHQSRAIIEIQLLLVMEKLLYTKADIETALSKDSHAHYRLGLFRNETAPRLDSGTDEVIHALAQKFQCR